MSKDVHFTPHDTSSSFDEEQVFRGVDRVGLLILALIIRCQLLLGCVPEGVNKRYREIDRKSTRLNSSHLGISYAVFCLKKNKPDIAAIARALQQRVTADRSHDHKSE